LISTYIRAVIAKKDLEGLYKAANNRETTGDPNLLATLRRSETWKVQAARHAGDLEIIFLSYSYYYRWPGSVSPPNKS